MDCPALFLRAQVALTCVVSCSIVRITTMKLYNSRDYLIKLKTKASSQKILLLAHQQDHCDDDDGIPDFSVTFFPLHLLRSSHVGEQKVQGDASKKTHLNGEEHFGILRREKICNSTDWISSNGVFSQMVGELVASLRMVSDEIEMYELMEKWKGKLGLKQMVMVLNEEKDWQRALALHDWMIERGGYPPSIYGYNVILYKVLRAKQWDLAEGLAKEMNNKGVAHDRYTFCTFITAYARQAKLHLALQWLHKMEMADVSVDFFTYTTIILLAGKKRDYSKAIFLFTRLKTMDAWRPDIFIYNTMVDIYGSAGLFDDAKSLFVEMRTYCVGPDATSYRNLLVSYVRNREFTEALNVYKEMKSFSFYPDLPACNAIIKACGHLGMVIEAEEVFHDMKKKGVSPNIKTYNTMLRLYEEAHMFGEAILLFARIQKRYAAVTATTYNTMIKIFSKALDYERAASLLQEMQDKNIRANSITYSTLISMYGKAGKHKEAEEMFQRFRLTKVKMDEALYYSMILIYVRAGLIGHANRLLLELNQTKDLLPATAIRVLAKAGKLEEATWLFHRTLSKGEIQDTCIFELMMDLFAKKNMHYNIPQVYKSARQAGLLPSPTMLITLFQAYEKLQHYDQALSLYREIEAQGSILPEKVHFQVMHIYARKGDLEAVITLFEKLELDDNIDKKALYLSLSHIYLKLNRPRDAFRITSEIERRVELSEIY